MSYDVCVQLDGILGCVPFTLEVLIFVMHNIPTQPIYIYIQ